MNIRPPLQEKSGSQGWSNFFTQLFEAIGWVKAWSYRFAIDFPSVPNHSQSAGVPVTIKGVRQGDAVQVTPFDDVAGMFFKGIVTADDTVTLYACNFSNTAFDAPEIVFRVVVTQNYN